MCLPRPAYSRGVGAGGGLKEDQGAAAVALPPLCLPGLPARERPGPGHARRPPSGRGILSCGRRAAERQSVGLRERRSRHRAIDAAALPCTAMQAKETVRALLDRLSDECTLQDVLYHLYVLSEVEQGRQELEEGRGIPHEQVAQELRRKWQLAAE